MLVHFVVVPHTSTRSSSDPDSFWYQPETWFSCLPLEVHELWEWCLRRRKAFCVTWRRILLEICSGSFVSVTGKIHPNESRFAHDVSCWNPKGASARERVPTCDSGGSHGVFVKFIKHLGRFSINRYVTWTFQDYGSLNSVFLSVYFTSNYHIISKEV